MLDISIADDNGNRIENNNNGNNNDNDNNNEDNINKDNNNEEITKYTSNVETSSGSVFSWILLWMNNVYNLQIVFSSHQCRISDAKFAGTSITLQRWP